MFSWHLQTHTVQMSSGDIIFSLDRISQCVAGKMVYLQHVSLDGQPEKMSYHKSYIGESSLIYE